MAVLRRAARADRRLAVAWWAVLVLRGLLPAVFAIAMGRWSARCSGAASWPGRWPPSASSSCCSRCSRRSTRRSAPTSATAPRPGSTTGSPRPASRPPGMGHLEDPELTSDLTVARDFDLGMTGPPLSISMDFIAGGLVEMVGGLASAVVLFGVSRGGRRSCSAAPGWRRTGCCARARSGATATPTRCASAQRDADYAYRLAVDPPAAKELRLFGLAGWTIDRFVARRTRAARAAVRGDPAARAAGASGACCSSSAPTSSCSGRWPTPRPTAGSTSAGSSTFAQARGRHLA